MGKKMESMQKYIKVLEDLPFHVKRLVMKNKNLKAEIQKLKDAPEIGTIGSHCADMYTCVRLAKYDKCL